MQALTKRAILTLLVFVLAGLVNTVASPLSLADPPPCADLVITGFSVNPPQPIQGQGAEIRITVKNQGTCPSLSFVVQWKSHQLAPTGPSSFVPGLSQNQSHVVTFDYAFPAAGDYTTVATVDSDNTAPETNESNNVEILPVTVRQAAPDLTIPAVEIVPAMPVQGITAKVNVQIMNAGNVDAGPFVVQWKSHQIAPTGPSTQLAGLEAGQTTWVSFDYAFPNAGNFTTIATVDTDGDVAESNEDNNTFIKEVTVHVAAPDLVITGFSIVPVDPAPGYPLLPVAGLNARVNIWVTNQGNAPAGTFVVQWKSALTALTGPSSNVASLAPGKTELVTFEYAFPSAGHFTTLATVDSDNTVAEYNESNNIDVLSVSVQRAVIDLVLTDFKVEPAPGVPASIPPRPVQGRLSRVTIEVENHGNYPAGDFVVQWRPAPFSAPLSAQVNGLKYGQSTVVEFDYTYQFPGEFATTATADSTYTVWEIDESNNSKTIKIVVEPPLPDLVITSFEFDPEEPVQGAEALVRIEVLNRGNTDAGPFLVRWKPNPLAQDVTTQVNGLGYNQSTVVQFYYTYYWPGQFTTTAEVDSARWVRELHEDNNIKTQQVTVQRAVADLIINDFRIGQGHCPGFEGHIPITHPPFVEPIVEQGADIKACIRVQNLGNSAVGPFVVKWNPDAWGLIVPSLNSLSSQIDELGAGQEEWVIFDFVYPKPGQFRTVAEVDAFNSVRETNEFNNLDILNVVVLPSGPDLAIDKMAIAPKLLDTELTPAEQCDLLLEEPRPQVGAAGTFPSASVEQGRPALVCIRVKNDGNRPAQEFIVEWNPDAWGLITPSPGTVSRQVEGLDVDQTQVVIFEFTYNQAGTFHTVAKADAFNNVVELNEANNLATLDLEVGAAGPDLVITALSISPQSPKQGQAVDVRITVENRGSRPAGPFVVEWNPDAWGLITPSPGTLSTQIAGLAPSQSEQVEFKFTYHKRGEFRTVAKADAFNNVAELNEANNLAILNVVVGPPVINLTIDDDSFAVTPDKPDRGSKMTATFDVCETENAYPTGAFSVQWIPTGEGAFGPVKRIQGLMPGQCETVTLESTILVADVYTSLAIVDIYDEIIETDESESDNRATTTIDVQPRETTIVLENLKIDVIDSEGDCEYILDGDWVDCDGEWAGGFAVVDPAAADFYQLDDFYDGGVEDDTVVSGGPFEVTLVESFPLIFGALAIEVDIASANEELGFALVVWGSSDYLNVGSRTVEGQKGVCSGGRCFDLKYTVTIKKKPAPPYLGGSSVALPPLELVELPPGLSMLIPEDAELPEGLARAPVPYDTSSLTDPSDAMNVVYLPMVQR